MNTRFGWLSVIGLLLWGGCIVVTDDGGGGGGGGGVYGFYDGCDVAGSCFDGTCYQITYADPGGAGSATASMCTEACTSMNCPAGGTCLSIDGMVGALCYKQCAWGGDAACPSGFTCTPVVLTTGAFDYVCLPGISDPGLPAYESCPGSGTCAWPNECYTVSYRDASGATGTANQCTRECTTQQECVGDALCLNIEMMSRSLCYQRCDDTLDCAPGFSCEAVDVAGVLEGVCLPAR